MIRNELPTKKQILKWTQALRSGEFTQGKGELHNNAGHCCLGVACEIFTPEGNKVKVEFGRKTFLEGKTPHQQTFAPLWLKEINHHVWRAVGTNLSALNDNGWEPKDGSWSDDPKHLSSFTFDEIADILEAIFIHEVLPSSYFVDNFIRK